MEALTLELDHVGVFVADLARSERFCVERFGMKVVARDEDEAVFMVTLRRDQAEVHLFQAKDGLAAARLDHVAWKVDAIDPIAAQLREAGTTFSGPHRYQDTRFIKVKDPDGVITEFIEHLRD